MAAENYIRDLSEYLKSGNLSDLTLNFSEKSWQIHKALACCHSNWFHKAVTGGFEENFSGVITLKDDPEFADAIDCMVSYFYEAGYNASKYDTSESLLHAQVTIIADKYDCASLYKLAKTSFANALKAVESNDWAPIADLIYDHTTTELPAHVELRELVAATAVDRSFMLKSILQNESIVELLRSKADLATDLLLRGMHGRKAEDASKYIFICDKCDYAHVGPCNCSNGLFCPKCGNEPGTIFKKHVDKVHLLPAFFCPLCYGIHSIPPPEPEPSS